MQRAVLEGGQDRAGMPAGGLVAGYQAMKLAQPGRPFPLAFSRLLESGRPGQPAVERPDNERHARAMASLRQQAGKRGAQGNQAMDDAELAGANAAAEFFPDPVLEIRIRQCHQAGQRPPASVGAAAKTIGKAVHRADDGFGVDGGEIPALDQPRAQDRGAISHLRDQVGVGQCGDRAGVRPPHQRNADPLRIAPRRSAITPHALHLLLVLVLVSHRAQTRVFALARLCKPWTRGTKDASRHWCGKARLHSANNSLLSGKKASARQAGFPTPKPAPTQRLSRPRVANPCHESRGISRAAYTPPLYMYGVGAD